MNVLRPTNRFLKDASLLPEAVKNKLRKTLIVLEENPFHPSLRSKPLHGELAGLFSSRIGKDYPMIFRFEKENKETTLLSVKNRKDIYKK